MNAFKRLAYSGISKLDTYQIRRSVMLSNVISIVYCLAIVLLFVIRRIFYAGIPNEFPLALVLLGIFIFLLPVLLNFLKFKKISRVLLSLLPISYAWLVFLSIMRNAEFLEASMYDSLRMFLLVFGMIPYLLFTRREKFIMILAILPGFLSILFFEVIFSAVGLSYFDQAYPIVDYELIQMRSIMVYFILSTACYTFQSIIDKSDRYSQKILQQLSDKSLDLVGKNEELKAKEERLNQLNANLESLVRAKTASLMHQNEVLMKYAYSNAHYVRGPLARLLGLVQLSKLDKHLSYPDLFEKMDYELLDLDSIIKDISKELNSIDEATLIDKN